MTQFNREARLGYGGKFSTDHSPKSSRALSGSGQGRRVAESPTSPLAETDPDRRCTRRPI